MDPSRNPVATIETLWVPRWKSAMDDDDADAALEKFFEEAGRRRLAGLGPPARCPFSPLFLGRVPPLK